MKLKKLTAIVMLSSVATCATADTTEELMGKCSSYGFTRGTSEFAQCVMQEKREANCDGLWLATFGTSTQQTFGGQAGEATKAVQECKSRL